MSDRLAEIKARHQQIEMVSEWGADSERYPACKRCRDPWPCDTMVLLTEGERLQQELDRRDVWQAWQQGKLPTDKADYERCHRYMDQHELFGDEYIEWGERGRALVEAGRAEGCPERKGEGSEQPIAR